MALTWQLSEIRSTFRDLIGRHSTGEVSNAAANNWINDYYVNYFPEEAGVANFQTNFTQDVTPTDSGEYALAQTVLTIEEPATIDGSRIALWTDKEGFFDKYPKDEHYVTPPTLVIGSSATTAVKNAAFKYRIAGQAYAKASAETALSGSAVPANRYGAWLLMIDVDGVITVTKAGSNAIGYAAPGLAITAITQNQENVNRAVMGYVTVMHTSTFTPGVTALNASGISAAFTDGRPSLRNKPEAALVAGNTLFLRPKPDDWYRFESILSQQRPSALSGDSDAPTDVKWGKCLAVGAAILWLSDKEAETERLTELNALKRYLLRGIQQKQAMQWLRDQRTVQPAY